MDDFANALRGGYRKSAFFVQYNLIMLFGVIAFSLATASWVLLAAGAALEVAWLLSAPWFPAFRSWTNEHRDTLTEPVVEPPAAAVASPFASVAPAPMALDGSYKERVKRLGLSLREIRMSADEELRRVRSPELSSALTTLPEVAAAFERLCALHQRLSRFVAQNSRTDLEHEVTKLTEAFATEKDLGLRVTLRQALLIAQKRLEQHGKIVALHRASELRLDMIDSAAAHVRSSALAVASPDDFAGEIRGLMTHVTTVSALEHDSAEAPSSKRPSMGPATVVAGDG
jgi:hypothetical protein